MFSSVQWFTLRCVCLLRQGCCVLINSDNKERRTGSCSGTRLKMPPPLFCCTSVFVWTLLREDQGFIYLFFYCLYPEMNSYLPWRRTLTVVDTWGWGADAMTQLSLLFYYFSFCSVVILGFFFNFSHSKFLSAPCSSSPPSGAHFTWLIINREMLLLELNAPLLHPYSSEFLSARFYYQTEEKSFRHFQSSSALLMICFLSFTHGDMEAHTDWF